MKIFELPPSTRVAVSLMGEMPGRKMLKKKVQKSGWKMYQGLAEHTAAGGYSGREAILIQRRLHSYATAMAGARVINP